MSNSLYDIAPDIAADDPRLLDAINRQLAKEA
jgi:hypothetical protein